MSVDRSSCPARKHGDENAVVNHGCTCTDARAHRAFKQKERRVNAQLHGPAHVDSTGVARRLQALAAIGWSAEDVASQLGLTPRAVQRWRSGHYPSVSPRTAATVNRLYEQLQGTPGPSPRSRENATRSEWAPPLLWHDRSIDDPNARPARDDPTTQRGVDLSEVRFLTRAGLSLDEAAARVGVQPRSISRAEQRAKQRMTRAAVDRAREAVRSLAAESTNWRAQPETRTRELEDAAS